MLNALQTFLLRVPDGLTGEAARYYIFLRIGFWIAASSHVTWAIVFWLNGVAFMGWYNLAVALAFAGAGTTWRRVANPLWLIVPLWFVEIPFHALLGTLFTGLDTLFWLVPGAAAIASLVTHQLAWTTRSLIAAAVLAAGAGIGIMGFLLAPLAPLGTATRAFLFVYNFTSVLAGLVLYLGLNQFYVQSVERRLQREFDRAEGLLKNILPDPIALRLKDGEHLIADDHAEVSVLFADIVNFTEASARLRPAELVETLNLVFSEFDRLAERHGAEKIKTIGDAYMAVVGIPHATGDHAAIAVALALDMLDAARTVSARTRFPIDLRIGINSGPVVAGVIGRNKFAYDLWGDAVNVASRMENHGAPGSVLITEATRALLPGRFDVRPDGTRDVKGKGEMSVYLVCP